MSQENVDAARRAFAAWNRRDLDALLDELDPEVEWHPGIETLLGGEVTVYRGREAALEALQGLFQAFDALHLEIWEVRDIGDQLLAFGRMRARGLESGAEIESPWAYLIRFKSGKATWVRAFLDHTEALEAAGLSE